MFKEKNHIGFLLGMESSWFIHTRKEKDIPVCLLSSMKKMISNNNNSIAITKENYSLYYHLIIFCYLSGISWIIAECVCFSISLNKCQWVAKMNGDNLCWRNLPMICSLENQRKEIHGIMILWISNLYIENRGPSNDVKNKTATNYFSD